MKGVSFDSIWCTLCLKVAITVTEADIAGWAIAPDTVALF